MALCHTADCGANASSSGTIFCVPVQAAAEEHLSGLAEWQAPSAGMFLWLRLLGVRDADDVLGELKAASVVVVPGGTPARASPSFASDATSSRRVGRSFGNGVGPSWAHCSLHSKQMVAQPCATMQP